ncbi:aminoglycoside phosphotransferase family protein, partial [Candidatus Woesearchaeota archaeon]|nr:aminoglycoside phosphotransferase family protein [Candidatus Woesearchaeota archaeon]
MSKKFDFKKFALIYSTLLGAGAYIPNLKIRSKEESSCSKGGLEERVSRINGDNEPEYSMPVSFRIGDDFGEEVNPEIELGYKTSKILKIKQNKINEIRYQELSSKLENIVLSETETNNKIKEFTPIYNFLTEFNSKSQISEKKEIEYIIQGNSGLKEMVNDYRSIGYTLNNDKGIVIPDEEAIKRTPEQAEVIGQRLPAEYRPILAMLAKKFSGVKYRGVQHMEKSRHKVDILTFEYQVDGQTQQIHFALKDRNELEEKMPAFLKGLGIEVHSVYEVEAGRAFVMQHVGDRSLRQAISSASESDIRKLSEKALETIAQVHVLATAHLHELKRDFGIELPTLNHNQEFRRRFLEPVSGHSKIISPQMSRLMQAYAAFARAFTLRSVIHGDYHDVNCRTAGDVCYGIDWESAAKGMEFVDTSRLTNSVSRDRPDMDAAEFSRENFRKYIEKHNEFAEQEKAPLMLANERLAAIFGYSLINDELYKAGEYVLFGEDHEDVKEEKMQKSR